MKFIIFYFSNLHSQHKNINKTIKRIMSCHSGDIPARQEFVLFDRKKHCFRVEKANMESWDLVILD